MTEKVEKGKRRSVWLPTKLDEQVEDTRKELGLGKSAFIKYAIIQAIIHCKHPKEPPS